MPALRVIAVVLGIIIALGAAFAFVLDVIAFIDPVGAKGADDNDPFGPPPSRSSIALQALVTLVAGALAAWLVIHQLRKLRRKGRQVSM